jgi:N-acetylglutamate synthase-like GNAT family acetyltransferase
MQLEGSQGVPGFEIRPLAAEDRIWVKTLLREHWGSERSVSRGRVHSADALPGFFAVRNRVPIGLATYHIENSECEIVTLNSLEEEIGVAAALIESIRAVAAMAGCRRLWLITTNDNVKAQEYYKRRGFSLKAVHKDAVRESRKLKPEIPETGMNGIPIRDEIEFELTL